VPELEVEFVLHGDGPASNWAEQVQVGQSLVMAGPGPNYQIDPAADWYFLAGDDTAIPAISSILENLPATARAYVLLEVGDAQEEQVLHSPAELEVTWLHRGSRPADAPLEQAVRDFKLPAGNGRVYVGCEAAVMRRIRQHLLKERGLTAANIVTRGYWKHGAVAYTDHDYGTD
jgi:NADPH-dependent ferric siderophore reductase